MVHEYKRLRKAYNQVATIQSQYDIDDLRQQFLKYKRFSSAKWRKQNHVPELYKKFIKGHNIFVRYKESKKKIYELERVLGPYISNRLQEEALQSKPPDITTNKNTEQRNIVIAAEALLQLQNSSMQQQVEVVLGRDVKTSTHSSEWDPSSMGKDVKPSDYLTTVNDSLTSSSGEQQQQNAVDKDVENLCIGRRNKGGSISQPLITQGTQKAKTRSETRRMMILQQQCLRMQTRSASKRMHKESQQKEQCLNTLGIRCENILNCLNCCDRYNADFKKFLKLDKSDIERYGVFTRKKIESNLYFARYEGKKRQKCIRSHYIVQMKNSKEFLDGFDSIAIYVNHSCDPNCRLEQVTVNEDSELWLQASRLIKANEEITINYGYDLPNCKCSKCRDINFNKI